MKQLLLAIALMATTITRAQIVMETNYPLHSQLTVVKIEGEGEKYLGAHAPSKTVTLYNPDHSVFRSFQPNPILFKPFAMYASYPSKYLFDADAGIEVLVAVIDTTGQSFVYNLLLCNEDGSIQHYFSLSFGAQLVQVAGAWKLITTQPMQTPPSTEVWALPGQWTGILPKDTTGPIWGSLSPSPMSNFALLRYVLPGGASSATVTVKNMSGQQVAWYHLTDRSGAQRIDRGSLPAGVYTWTLTAGNGEYISDKFVIQ